MEVDKWGTGEWAEEGERKDTETEEEGR